MVSKIAALIELPENAFNVKVCFDEQATFELCVFNNYETAKSALLVDHFDLIISDVHLENGGSVFDFLKWVKSQPRLRPIPFTLLSVQPTNIAKYIADGVSTAARTLGAAKYITMPKFDAVTLIEEISELLPVTISKKDTVNQDG